MYKQFLYLIKVNGGHLDPISSRIGLKQGGVLSPLLFNLYIDDIKDIFDDSCCPVDIFENPLSHLLYADDLVLMSNSNAGLNNCLSKLAQYCDKWQLEVNFKKSKVVIFNQTGRVPRGQKFYMHGISLEVIKSYCYLGIDMTCSGSFHLARTNLIEKASKAMYPLRSTVNQFNIPCVNALNLFHTLIRPIGLYCSENWNYLTFSQINSLEQNKMNLFDVMTSSNIGILHQKIFKYILGVNTNCSNSATLGDLGEYPLMIHGFVSLLKFWHRTVNLPDKLLVKQAMSVQTDFIQSEWMSTVKFLLGQIGLNAYFENPKMVKTEAFAKICLTKLKEKFIKQWKFKIANTDKLRFYRLFKTEFRREFYLDLISNFQLRRCISKFRCSDHRLEIEVGRHRNIPAESRYCATCVTEIETVEHFLRWCPRYNYLRMRYFGRPQCFLDWLDILKCKNKISAYNLGNFITKALDLRNKSIATEFMRPS